MKKIVIVNNAHSCTFSLSTKLLTRYFELANLGKPYFYIRKFSLSVNINSGYVRVEGDLDDYFYTSLNDLGEVLSSKQADDLLYSDENYFGISSILRDDVNLVQAVEELKPENLKVISIPDDVKEWYVRQEDDGFESIHEMHRSWF